MEGFLAQMHEQAQVNLLLSILSPPEDQRNQRNLLKEDELRWAYQIKDAIFQHNETANNNEDGYIIQDLCDYEIAQWAVTTLHKRNLQEIVDGIYKLQCFREQYKLKYSTNTDGLVEEGMELLAALFNQQPGFILNVDFMPQPNHYLYIVDGSAFDPTRVRFPNDWRKLSGGLFYLNQILTSNLQATREGYSFIAECMDLGFHNINPQLEERFVNEFSYYPIICKECLCLNTPMAANFLFSLWKPFVTEDMRNCVRLGCYLRGYEGNKIDKLFQIPTPEIAQMRLLERCRGYLQERQTNQSTYQLPPLPAPTG